jgi:hypothetical protein
MMSMDRTRQGRSELDTGPTAGRRQATARPKDRSPYAEIQWLQQTAGNAAVAQRLAVQRHADPTDEAGWQPSAPAPPGLADDPAGGTQPAPDQTAAPDGTQPAATAEQPASAAPADGATQAPAEAPLVAGPTTGATGAGSNLANLLASLPASLDSTTAGARFAKDMVSEERAWATQAGPAARAQALTDMIGRRLADAGVSPVPTYTLRTDLAPSTLGNFGFPTWTININQALVSRATLTPDQADQIANTFYHEGRHCDQWFRMARMRAGQGAQAADIARVMGIPNNVAVAAAANPIAAGTPEAAEVQVWWDSIYGSHHDARNATLKELSDSDTANAAAAAAYAADHSAANLAAWQAANTRTQTAFVAYQALPEEVSARAAASTMQAALTAARLQEGKPPDAPFPRPPGLEGAGDFEPAPSGDQGVG